MDYMCLFQANIQEPSLRLWKEDLNITLESLSENDK